VSTLEPAATVARLLHRSEAHAGLATALGSFPFELTGRRAEGHPHTAWELVEHLRLAAEDLVAYCGDAAYRELDWPDGYWPAAFSPPSPEGWEESVRRVLAAGDAMAALLEDGQHDLYAPVPSTHEPHHHRLRAALVLLDHNGYHAGQLVALRRALGAWPP
jgi:hypothetical protein